MRHEDSSLITTDGDIDKEWEKYFGDLLNYEEPEVTYPFKIGNGDAQDCIESALDESNDNLKINKSPGEDEIQAKLLE